LPKSYSFDAVIVDEAQDLTAVQARLLLALDKSPDHKRFLMVGDGQQRIYRGGFTLRQVGIDVGGRSRILRGNWRNTYWIWAVTQHLTEGVPFPGLEGSDQERVESRSSEPRREGEPVTLHVVESEAAETKRVVELASAIADGDEDLGECAVVVWKADREKQILAALRTAGIAAMPMSEWAGASQGRIVVGTAHRSKGLEFKQVVVCGMSEQERTASINRSSSLTEEEATALELRLATVAMTRARDRLSLVSPGAPWVPVAEAADLLIQSAD
jgi:superfamily I DNA/RNA helicase